MRMTCPEADKGISSAAKCKSTAAPSINLRRQAADRVSHDDNSQYGVTGADVPNRGLGCEFRRTHSSEPQAEGSRS